MSNRVRPGRRRDPFADNYLATVRAGITKHGWMIQGVFGQPGGEWAYTIGLTAAGVPELVLVGLPTNVAGVILNTAARHALGADELTAGAHIDTDLGVQLRVGQTLPQRVALTQLGVARAIYGSQLRALQLLWPDDSGQYPGDPDWTLGSTQTFPRPPDGDQLAPVVPE